MLPHQPTGFGLKLENGKRRCLVYVKRLSEKLGHAGIQLLPFIWCQLSCLKFFTRNFAHIGQQTHAELHTAHLKREKADRNAIVNSHILSH